MSLDDIGHEFLSLMTNHNASHRGKDTMWDFLQRRCSRIAELVAEGETLPKYQTLRDRSLHSLPSIQIVQVIESSIGEQERIEGAHGKRVPEGSKEMYTEARVQVNSFVIQECLKTYLNITLRAADKRRHQDAHSTARERKLRRNALHSA